MYQIKALASTIKTLEYRVKNNRGRGDKGGNIGGRSGGGKTIAIVTAESTIVHMAMVDTKGQPAETNPMTIERKLHSKKNGRQNQMI